MSVEKVPNQESNTSTENSKNPETPKDNIVETITSTPEEVLEDSKDESPKEDNQALDSNSESIEISKTESSEEIKKEETTDSNSPKSEPETIAQDIKKGDENSEDDDNEDSEDDENEDSDDTDLENNDEEKDYSNFSDEELVEELEKTISGRPIQEINRVVQEIRSEFNGRFNEEMAQKKEEFLAEGGNIIDFHFSTPLKQRFNSLFFDFKEKRNTHHKNLKKDLQANLTKRWELIEELKGLLNTEENINSTYKHFKEIQEKWHVAGPIPRDNYNTVWNTYHHHVENFYDFMHLNREFRDMDFKHNLDTKLKMIMRAEELAKETDINKAFRELQMLHKMWKEEIGPVAKEYRDEVWDKFSDATKVIHDKRQGQLQELEQKQEENFDKKKELIDQINHISENTKPSHSAWQNAINKVQELRNAYFAIGGVPRTKNKEIWKSFKDATSSFNHGKNTFYKDQKSEQFVNLEKKRELVKIAEENKDSEDVEATANLMKKIQNDWKQIGHVPRKESDKIWKEFKSACNHFFDRLHAKKNEASEEEVKHYEAKKELLDKIGNLELNSEHKENLKSIKDSISAWKEIGRVPYNKRQIEQKFNKVLDGLFSKLDISKKESELIKFDNKLNTLVNREDDRKLQNEHFFISKKIDETKDEIRQLENNLGFFHNVKSDNPLVKDVHKNIEKQKEQLEVWKAKLRKIKEVREE